MKNKKELERLIKKAVKEALTEWEASVEYLHTPDNDTISFGVNDDVISFGDNYPNDPYLTYGSLFGANSPDTISFKVPDESPVEETEFVPAYSSLDKYGRIIPPEEL